MDRFARTPCASATPAMPDWFDKARQTVTRQPGRSEPEPFERTCVCGETLRGERLPQAQEFPCPGCGRGWFVLPLDPYPRARARSTKPPLWKRLTTNGASADTAVAPAARKAKPSKPLSGTTAPMPRPRKPPPAQRLRERFAATKASVRERLKKGARPLRLVAAGIVAILLLTGAWLWHRSRVDAAAATLVSAVPEAERAILKRDFATARRLYGDAAAAVDVLGAEDAKASDIRQRHRELVAQSGLAAQTPYDLAAQAERLSADPKSWTQQFAAVYGGRWVILDVPLGEPEAPTPASGSPKKDAGEPATSTGKVVRLDLPLVAGEFPVRFEIDAALIKPLKSAERAIFAAQYDSWRLHPEGKGRAIWVVRFRPDTAFLWCSPDLYAALGFDPDVPEDPPRAVLARQAKAVGVPTESTSRNGDEGSAD